MRKVEERMIKRVIEFILLPMLMLVIYATARFLLGVFGVPYAPRGNAVFSVLGLAVISCVYYGALSKRVGGFGWGGTILTGYFIGLFAQILIFTATLLTFLLGLDTYYTHWDALNVPEGTVVSMGDAMTARAVGLVFGPVLPTIAVVIGRLLSGLAPKSKG